MSTKVQWKQRLNLMFLPVHPVVTSLRGDESYNARSVQVRNEGPGLEAIVGVYKDDGVGPHGVERRPDRPFCLIIPWGVDWTWVNMEAFHRLQRDESLSIGFAGWPCRN